MAIIDKKSSNAEKVVFFRSLFSGRGDICVLELRREIMHYD